MEFTYKQRTAEQVKERLDSNGKNKEPITKPGINLYSPKAGKNKLRILPPTFKGNHYGYDVYIHYNINKAAFICPKTVNKPCPICEEVDRNFGDKAMYQQIGAKKKIAIWVIDRDLQADGPKLFLMPTGIDKNFIIQAVDDDGKILYVDDPINGYDVSFVKEGELLKTKYTGETIARTPSPLSTDFKESDAWLNFIMSNPVPAQFRIKDYDYIKKVFDGKEYDPGEENEVIAIAEIAPAREIIKNIVKDVVVEKEVVREEPKRIIVETNIDKVKKAEPETITIDTLLDMEEDALRNYALGVGVKARWVDMLPIKELIEEICEIKQIEIPIPTETSAREKAINETLKKVK